MDASLGDQVIGQIGGRVADDLGAAVGHTAPVLSASRRSRIGRDGQGARIGFAAMAKTLVTGASGFIGSHLARALADRGDELRLLAAARIEPRPPRRPRVRARDGRHHRPACGAAGDEGGGARLPCRRIDLDARRRPRAGLHGQRDRHPQRGRGGDAGRGRAGGPHLLGGSGRAGAGPAEPPTRRSRSPPAISASPTSTPSTRPRWRRCVPPPAACRWSSSTRPSCSAPTTPAGPRTRWSSG